MIDTEKLFRVAKEAYDHQQVKGFPSNGHPFYLFEGRMRVLVCDQERFEEVFAKAIEVYQERHLP